MTKKNIHFIINPISGTGKQKNILHKIEQVIDTEIFDFKIHYTERKNHANQIAQELSKSGPNIIVAIGGDGTVNEVSKALANTDSVLGVIPTGSGNGLARHLNIPSDIEKALRLINTYKVRQIDTCTANGNFFINVSGVGFDGHIAHAFSKSIKRGIKTYIKLIASEWRTYAPKKFEIKINNEVVFRDKALLVSFANGSQYGNNAHISPSSTVDDGQLEICILKPFPTYEIPSMLIALIRGRLHLHKNMINISCSKATIHHEGAMAHLDGEPVELSELVELKVHPKNLHIITA